jgi:fatty-acyl-CoA synthase
MSVTTDPAVLRTELDARFRSWRPRTISELFNESVERYPDRVLIRTGDATYTYTQVQEWSRALAGGLLERGIGPGDHVAMVIGNHPEFVAVKLAIAQVGATAVPINYLLRPLELGYVLRQSDSVLAIIMNHFRDADYLAGLDELMPGWVEAGGGEEFPELREVVVFDVDGSGTNGATSLRDLASTSHAEDVIAAESRVTAYDPSDVLYTSGTTGGPKGVVLTHDMVVRTAYGAAYSRAVEDGRQIAFAMPMYHVFGYVECLMTALFVGGTLLPQAQFDPHEMLSWVEQHGVNEIVCVPTMTLALLDAAENNRFDLSSLHTVFSSGGKTPANLWDRIDEVLEPRWIITGYGQTETTAATAMTLPEDDRSLLRTTNGRLRQAGAAGDPELGGLLADYKVVHPVTEKELPPGEQGHLLVRGPIVTKEYYRKPDETRAVMTNDGWLRTGDLGTLTDGFIKLTGRIKESYRCGGEQVLPSEVELVIEQHPAVDAALLVGVPDDRMGEVGFAFVVLQNGATATEDELIEFCHERMARFKVPAHLMFTNDEALPRTVTGKIQKFVLAETASQLLAQGHAGTSS